jgi:hypothetical protein
MFCTASFGARFVRGIADIGSGVGNVIHDVIPMTFTVTPTTSQTASLKCHHETLDGAAPAASDAYLELVKLGAVTSESVSG